LFRSFGKQRWLLGPPSPAHSPLEHTTFRGKGCFGGQKFRDVFPPPCSFWGVSSFPAGPIPCIKILSGLGLSFHPPPSQITEVGGWHPRSLCVSDPPFLKDKTLRFFPFRVVGFFLPQLFLTPWSAGNDVFPPPRFFPNFSASPRLLTILCLPRVRFFVLSLSLFSPPCWRRCVFVTFSTPLFFTGFFPLTHCSAKQGACA